MHKAVASVVLAGIASALILTQANEASAQTNVRYVTPTVKGITGCALLGAEAVALIEAAAGVRARWAYVVFPLMGAAAGGVGGYFLESAAGDGSDTTLTGISVGTLVLGLGLIVPSVIAYVGATSYRPEHDQPNEDAAPSNTPIDEASQGGSDGATTAPPASSPSAPSGSGAPSDGSSGGSSSGSGSSSSGGSTSSIHPMRRTRGLAAPTFRPTGLFDVSPRGFSLAVPAISVESSVSLQEMRQYGLAAQSEVRVPLFSGAF